jgi:hypothetical protein
LKVTGSHLHRLILEDNNGYTAVLDKPTEQTRLPLGTYSLSETWVRSGTLQAVSTAGRRIEIKADSALALLAGGPLTNSVILERKRETLNMSYQLIGIDGEKYRLQPEDRDHPPTYTVWLSGRQVATGKFAYG